LGVHQLVREGRERASQYQVMHAVQMRGYVGVGANLRRRC
jgi:hypothetical protein